MREPPALFVRQAIIARRPGIDLDIVDVGDAAFGQGRSETRIGSGHLADQHDVVEQNTRPRAGHMPPIDNLISDEIYPALPDLTIAAIERAHEGFAGKAHPWAEAVHHALVRFAQADGLEQHAGSEIMGGPHRGRRETDLARRQRVERMGRPSNGSGFCNAILHADPLDVGLKKQSG